MDEIYLGHFKVDPGGEGDHAHRHKVIDLIDVGGVEQLQQTATQVQSLLEGTHDLKHRFRLQVQLHLPRQVHKESHTWLQV